MTTKELFEQAARACVTEIDNGSPQAFIHLAVMVACCRIDSPNPIGMEKHMLEVESELREQIKRGELTPIPSTDEPLPSARPESEPS